MTPAGLRQLVLFIIVFLILPVVVGVPAWRKGHKKLAIVSFFVPGAAFLVTLGNLFMAAIGFFSGGWRRAFNFTQTFLYKVNHGEMPSSRGQKKFLSDPANLLIRDKDGNTALMGSAFFGFKPLVAAFIQAGADVNAANTRGSTALSNAVERGYTDIMEMLIGAGADVNANGGKMLINACAGSNKRDAAILLIEKGAGLDFTDDFGATALMYALKTAYSQRAEFIDVARMLIEKGADIQKAVLEESKWMWYKKGDTALLLALSYGKKEVADLLLEKGAAFDTVNSLGNTPLILAAENGYEDIVRLLISRGVGLEPVTTPGGEMNERYTALKRTVNGGHLGTMLALIESATDDNQVTEYINAAIKIAASNGYMDIVKILIEAGADVNTTDEDGTSLFMYAVAGRWEYDGYERHTDIVKMLMKAGANIYTTNQYGRTALMFAAEAGHVDTLKLLINRGADVNDTDKVDGSTALIYAAKQGKAVSMNILMDAGADVDYPNKKGVTARSEALKKGLEIVIKDKSTQYN